MQGVNKGIFGRPVFWLWLLFGLAAVFVSLRNLLLPDNGPYTHYNNYVIFANSFYHWYHGLNLYVQYLAEQYDLFKYSPFFAMLFGAFAILPAWLGLALWNFLNFGVLARAVQKLPLGSESRNLIFGLLILQEAITAGINSQSNSLIAGLLILGWLALNDGRWWKAAALIGFTVFIKLFGILFFALFLLYPKWWKGVVPVVAVCLAMLLLPAISGGFKTLMMQYKGYAALLANDHGEFVKYSVMGWLQSWFGFNSGKNLIVLIGLLLQLVVTFLIWPFRNQQHVRALYAASWLVWMVIFNHMAESATFIIAVTGVIIWYFFSSWPFWVRTILLLPVLAFTCFGPSDIYPPHIRQLIVIDWQLKAFPCILVWVVISLELAWSKTFFSTRTQALP